MGDPMTTFGPDIIIRGRDGSPVAAVEVKNQLDLSQKKAIALRRHYTRLSSLFAAPFFLLVSQDRGFLWRRATSGNGSAKPAAEFPMDNVVVRYLPTARGGTRLQEPVLELLVSQWLMDLAEHSAQRPRSEPEQLLAQVGFLDSVKGGVVEAQA